MNKILQVNIGGTVFQMEEPAYRNLDRYLSHIRRNKRGADAAEILSDMEQRIAELLQEQQGQQAFVNATIVNRVIDTMGRPQDFDTYSQSGPTGGSRFPGFYRDTNNRFLGGVCSGIGNRFDIDALWVRLAFLVSFFVGGAGLLIYLILWILVPGLPKQ